MVEFFNDVSYDKKIKYGLNYDYYYMHNIEQSQFSSFISFLAIKMFNSVQLSYFSWIC